MIQKLYISPTYNCNLNCAHCSIHKQNSQIDIDAIIRSAKSLDYEYGILFGGEPLTLNCQDISRLFNEIKINAISTNLINMSRNVLDILIEHKASIATSWNPNRFDYYQYAKWIENIKLLLDEKLEVTVLITLTHDLFSSDVLSVLADLENIAISSKNPSCFMGVRFELYCPATNELVEESDNWLTQLHKKWNYNFTNILADEYKHGNLHFCSSIKSIAPDGTILNTCPTLEEDQFIGNCLKCKYNKVCRPCKKQKVCTFFKNFYVEVMSYVNEKRKFDRS